MSKYRKCVVCGNTYRYCPNCAEFKSLESWHNLYCSENCKKINYLYRDYNSGKKVKKELKKCDLSRKDAFREDIKKMLEKYE